MPYIVNPGQAVEDGSAAYHEGSFLPGTKGSLADMESAGVVTWKEAKKPAAKPKPEKSHGR